MAKDEVAKTRTSSLLPCSFPGPKPSFQGCLSSSTLCPEADLRSSYLGMTRGRQEDGVGASAPRAQHGRLGRIHPIRKVLTGLAAQTRNSLHLLSALTAPRALLALAQKVIHL